MMNLDLENPSPFWSIIKEDQVSCEQVLKLCRDMSIMFLLLVPVVIFQML